MAREGDEELLQLYVMRGRLVVRRYTRREPSPAQRLIRERFRAAAKSAVGSRMDDSLPPAALRVQEGLRGLRSRETRRHTSGLDRVLRALLSKRGYTEDEIDAILQLLA